MTDHTPPSTRLLPLDEAECIALLGTTTIGRVAFASSQGQQILPVNFTVKRERIYFQTVDGGVLAELAEPHDDVAFGVDYHDDTFQLGWSVVVQGQSRRVSDDATLDDLRSVARLQPWAREEPTLAIEIVPRLITGRKVSLH